MPVSDLRGLAEENFCYLTTTGRITGRPHEIEIWFALVPARPETRKRTSWRGGCWSRNTRAVLDVWRTGAAGRCPWWWISRSRGSAGVAPKSKDSATGGHVGAVWNKNRG